MPDEQVNFGKTEERRERGKRRKKESKDKKDPGGRWISTLGI